MLLVSCYVEFETTFVHVLTTTAMGYGFLIWVLSEVRADPVNKLKLMLC